MSKFLLEAANTNNANNADTQVFLQKQPFLKLDHAIYVGFETG